MVADPADIDDEKSTFVQVRVDPTELSETTFVLSVIEGPDRGRSIELDAARPSALLVGQGPACDLRLGDPSVSRRHARFELIGERVRIEDLDSTNGTRVAGIAVREAFAEGGENVQVGSTVIAISRGRELPEIELSSATRFGRLVFASSEMRRLEPLMQKLAASSIPVVIEGETGTGKELLAESLHECGPRASGPFVVFDCTAVPPNLLESELFGHKKGAFTGASDSRKGLFEHAHGGTLLIDEIGELDIALQSKLLRAIERREIRPIGENQSLRVDVRVLAATRRDLDREVAAGRFRDDLFHRLAVGRIELPPLRRRRGDVPLLVGHFCAELGIDARQIDVSVLARWEDHGWPGNVRELYNAVARYVALGEAGQHPPPSLPPDADSIDRVIGLGLPYVEARDRIVDEFTRRYLESALARSQGNVTRAAAASGMGRRYFQVLRSKTSS